MYNKLYYNCIIASFLYHVLPSYKPSWLAILGTRHNNTIHSFIYIETDILGVTKLREKQKET